MGPPGRPYVFRSYPTMMHRAARPPKGGAVEIVEQVTLESENTVAYFESRGFRHTPLKAIAAVEGSELEIAKLAANLEYQKTHTLSPKAVAEVEAAQAETADHLPSVPVTPIKPRAAKLEVKGKADPSETAASKETQ